MCNAYQDQAGDISEMQIDACESFCVNAERLEVCDCDNTGTSSRRMSMEFLHRGKG